MKRLLIFCLMILFLLPSLAMLSSCAASKNFIIVKQPDVVYGYENEIFEVDPDDVLEILEIRPRRDRIEIYWKVKRVRTGETGYVEAERMYKWHEVYIEEE
ncbi:MAG: hypothetical protein DRH07_02675 [Deltaproteobacteria bacterium]|nr:MAG: hypothetical protein DRH07_02675 [Deltaproteobacteria bacterium]